MASIPQSLGSSDLFSIAGKVILITGGGTGLGRFMAEGYVANGAKVYITGRRLDVLETTAAEINRDFQNTAGRGEVVALQGDVSTKASVQLLAEDLARRETKLDVLVNNAGAQRPWKNPITEHNDPDQVEKLLWEGVDDDDWNITNSVNLNGVYFMTAAMVPMLRKSDDPSVIIISSVAAFANQRPVSTLTYGVSKAGTVHLASMLAGRLAPMKIRVNTICPGAFPSEITAKKNHAGEAIMLPPAAAAAKRSPIGRPGYRHEIVGPALLLASKAGGFMDDAVLLVDGGRHMNAGINDGIRMPEDTYWPNNL
ncbi:hypothetical protein EHS25_008495 [Saitozyma podzolica]|uniref:Uncharacterized protein n=1 Tax=Saitozyma podzolica TaxID=1890683 RepID=A0A427YLX4_9TREE|nr:hypothetical protein EHS25_008495 [Saitozyma podzolica]